MCKNDELIKLAESCGLAWTGKIEDDGQPELIGSESAWSLYDYKLSGEVEE